MRKPRHFGSAHVSNRVGCRGRHQRRNQTLTQFPSKSATRSDLTLLRSAAAKGEKEVPTAEAIQKALKETPASDGLFVLYAAGRFVQKRGQDKLATTIFQKCVDLAINRDTIVPALAAVALRELAKAK